MLTFSVICKLFKVCGSDSTFVAHTFHPCVFLRVELLDVASALTRKLKLLSAGKAGEASFHVPHHNVNPQVALGASHVATSLTCCCWVVVSFVHLHVLSSGGLGVENQRTFVARQLLLNDDGISMLFCHVQHKVRMRLDGQIALRTEILEVLPYPITAIWTNLKEKL